MLLGKRANLTVLENLPLQFLLLCYILIRILSLLLEIFVQHNKTVVLCDAVCAVRETLLHFVTKKCIPVFLFMNGFF